MAMQAEQVDGQCQRLTRKDHMQHSFSAFMSPEEASET